MNKFAVIGANSFSGAAFCRLVAERGDAVVKLSRPEADLNKNMGWLVSVLLAERPDFIVNFAALNMVGESWDHYADYYRTNVIGVTTLAHHLLNERWLRQFIQVSTPEVYGNTADVLREDSAMRPSTPYAVSRAACDMHLMALHRAHGFPVSFTRTVNVYGPGQQLYRIIPKTVLLIHRGQKLMLHGGGTSARSFIHVDDASDGVYRVAMRGVPGRTYHTSTRDEVTIRALVEEICEQLGVQFNGVVEIDRERTGKDMAYRLHCNRARDELGWEPKIALKYGLRDTVLWFVQHATDFDGKSLEYTHRP